MIGEDGAHYFPYNFTLLLLIVTINVVALYEYLSHKFPPWGTIKGYCIVLYIKRAYYFFNQLAMEADYSW